MAYQTFALKYRPRNFDEIVGQDHVATTLRNAVAEGRVAHGYLFAGPRGTGKTSTARVLAKALACERGPTPDPCGECEICLGIDSGRMLDLIEIDAASHRGIDDIRELREGVGYAPTRARVKFYILDEAHMLTPQASNALLKTLEEPPPFVHFVLATTEPHNILSTIRSRCQTFEFRPIPPVLLVESLRAIADTEGITVEEEALGAIARAAGGAMRDAESIFDQAIAFAHGEVTLEKVNAMLGVTDAELLARFADAIASGDLAGIFDAVDVVVSSGKDIGQLLEDLALYFRDLLRLSLGVMPPRWMQSPATGRERMDAQAAAMGAQRIAVVMDEIGEAAKRLKETSQQSLLFEVTLAHLAAGAEGALELSGATAPVQQSAPAQETSPEPANQNRVGAAETPPRRDDNMQGSGPAPVTPEATAAPEPSGAAISLPEDGLTLESLCEHWPTICRHLEDTGQPAVAALVKDARPEALDATGVTLAFPGDYPWLRDRVNDAYAHRVSDALEALFGVRLSVRCVLPEGAAESAVAEVMVPAPEEEAEAAAWPDEEGDDEAEPMAEQPPAEPSEEEAGNRAPMSGADASMQERLVRELKLEFDGTEQ